MTSRERLKQFILAEIESIEAAEPDEELLKVLYLAVDGLDNLDFGQTDEIFAAADFGTRGLLPATAKRCKAQAIGYVLLLKQMGFNVAKAEEEVASRYGIEANRREDIPRLGPEHVSEGRIRFVQGKNEERAPMLIDIPVHEELAASIAATQTGEKTFLVTRLGKPFTTNGFGNWFRDRCNEAGLPHCSAHGVRKATAAALADNEATAHEIMSVTGHRSMKEVERYTLAADRKKNATRAIAKLK